MSSEGMTMTDGFTYRPIDGAPFGIEVELDPRVPLPARAEAELRALYGQHHLLLIRGTEMEYEEQRRLVGALGPVLAEAGKQYVSNARTDGLLGSNELAWHTDIPFTEHPYRGICLHAVDVEDGRTSTRFADMSRAYRTMPPDLKTRIERLDVLLVYRLDADFEVPSRVLPLVFEHPDTGEETISADQLHAQRIIGVPEDESVDLVQQLFEHQYGRANVYEHWWHFNDLIVWDNRAVHHARTHLDPEVVGRRTLRRVTLGTHTVQEQIANFTNIRDSYYPDTYYPKANLS